LREEHLASLMMNMHAAGDSVEMMQVRVREILLETVLGFVMPGSRRQLKAFPWQSEVVDKLGI
jgi:hypothetical protein